MMDARLGRHTDRLSLCTQNLVTHLNLAHCSPPIRRRQRSVQSKPLVVLNNQRDVITRVYTDTVNEPQNITSRFSQMAFDKHLKTLAEAVVVLSSAIFTLSGLPPMEK